MTSAPTVQDPAMASLTMTPESLVLEARIGRGGMGEVWRARDERLNRMLALKLLRPERSEQVGPLLAEARAQARIDHPHVCKVYGFGELDGTPFIALQLIDGNSLAKAAPNLSTEEKVRVLAQVAGGIEAAHRQGIIHRDIKPQNILVERHADRSVHAFVVDFGLARDVGSETEEHVAGTVEYMAPEQACGDRLDARTDVWGLGITLYELLAGRTPFRADTPTATLGRLLSEDPQPIEGVPRDLGRIVMKCLERPRERRYSTAAELRADLERFLAGEPVRAMPPSLLYRIGKRARRNRFAFVAGSFASVVLVVASVLLVRAQIRSVELARRSAEYARDIERFESTMHQAALLPLHDTRPERTKVETRLHAIEAELPRLRPEIAALAQHALGRAELALGQSEAAIGHLEPAYATAQTPEVGLALGRALAARYAEDLGGAANLPPEERNQYRKDLAARYGARIKQLLSFPTDEPGATDLARAQIAFAEERDDDALALIASALGRQPWMFEAHRLRAQVENARALRLSSGSDYDGAEATLGRADAAIGEALRIGPSDGTSRVVACELAAIAAHLRYDRSRLDAARFTTWQAACDTALEATGRSGEALSYAADLAATRARYEVEHGGDGSAAYRRALELARAATDSRPKSADAWAKRAFVERLPAQLGQPDATLLDDAVASGEQALRLAPRDPEVLRILAACLGVRAALLDREDAGSDLLRAVELAERATQLHPAGFRAHNALESALAQRASWQSRHGEDPRNTFRAALMAAEEVQRRNPNVDYGFLNGCTAAGAFAEFLLSQGENADDVLDRGARTCQKSLEIDANYFRIYEAYSDLIRGRATRDLGRGEDITHSLEEIIDLLTRGRRINPTYAGYDWEDALVGLLRAQALMRDGRDPSSAWSAVERAIVAGRAHPPKNDWQVEVQVALARAKAEWLVSHGQPVEAVAVAGIAAAHAGPGPRRASTLEVQLDDAALQLARAKGATGDTRRARAREAVELLERAVKANRNLAHLAAPLLAEARKLAGT
jgi:serine/threonine-protein kinase